MRRLAPGRLRQLEPIQLQLLTRRVLKLDRQRLPTTLTGRAGRAQPEPPQLARQRRVRAIEAERAQLAKQHGRVQVRIVLEAPLDVHPVGLQRARRPSRLTAALTPQPGTDRLAITARVPGDRANRPTAAVQSNDLHLVLP